MNILFGAGKLGKRYYTSWKKCGIAVDYFTDNDPQLWYSRVEGLEVIPPEKLKDLTDIDILITCADWEPIWRQLRELGVQDYQIRRCNSMELLAAKEFSPFWPSLKIPNNIELSPRSVIFALDGGLSVGGAESWSLNTMKKLRDLGWNARLLLSSETHPAMIGHEDKYMIRTIYAENLTVWENLSRTANSMLQYRNIICNFPAEDLMAAAFIKKQFPRQYRIIAVIHLDDSAYYQSFMDAEPYLDKCLIISSKIGNEMIKRGFPKEKLVNLPWKIPCGEAFSHCYSQCGEPLRIGYAGRIVVKQKRADLLLAVAKVLEERGLDFRMEVAGAGPFENEFRLQIQAAGLQNKVCFLGRVEDTASFWSRQDIMITCSEREGHSISQCEGMAAGAVPIITDTSGARDDVEDGMNGFLVNIGDIGQMVERICYLYAHREQLPILGERAHKTVLERNRTFDFQKLWENILLE